MSPRQRGSAVFVSAIILLLVSGVAVYALVAKLLDAERWIAHTYDVEETLTDVRALNGRTNRDRTEYIATGDPRFLEEYRTSLTERDKAVERVRSLTSDNSIQQQNCDRLESTFERLTGLLSDSIALKAKGQSDLERQFVSTREIADASTDIDSTLEGMNALERRLLEARRAHAAFLFRVTVVILFVAFVLAIGLLLLHYRLLEAELLGRAAAEARFRTQAALLDAANDAIWSADLNEKITYWNKGAERLYGWSREEAIGQSPHELLQTKFPVPFEEVARKRAEGGWQGELVHTKRDGTTVTVGSSWTRLEDARNNLTGWLQINTDISGQKRSEQSLRLLTGRLLRLQDEERRRIARELHDSAGQLLAAISMNLTPLESGNGTSNPRAAEAIRESLALVKELSSELRTISHLLHPPLLDEVGLASALRLYIEGFTDRSKINVELDIPDDFGRLPQELETAIFRVVQECLTNIHRHSGSPVARIRISHIGNHVRVEIEDEGTGIPTEKRKAMDSVGSPGVGINGMRERLRQLGGSLEVCSPAAPSEDSNHGTVITALLPAARPSSTAVA
jgi:PAS domain S-box-containing protein